MTDQMMAIRADAPLRSVRLGPMDAIVRRDPDGVIHVRSRGELAGYPNSLTERLVHWAAIAPDRTLIAAREGDGAWRRLTYAQTLQTARRIGQSLIDRGLSAERPIAILSGNDIDHALLALAALHVGIPFAAISPAYALVATDHERLRGIFETLTPGMVFVDDVAPYAPVLASVVPRDVEVVASNPRDTGATPFAALSVEPTSAVEAAAAKAGPDTVAKFLFTSGSTGKPKAVINTQRMICSNQQMIRQCFAFMQDEPPVILDWSPWKHTAGGNHNFGLALYNGGTFYIDAGKPTPAGIAETVRNLREVAPTWYFNVPKGFEALVPYLREEKALRENFFSRLKMLYVAGAGLAQPVWDELNRMAIETCGERILLGGGLGSTETAPFALVCQWEQKFASNCGLPAPGIDLKLAPAGGKLEARMKGPNITPGYWREPELTAKAFGEEGYYRLGDALRFADPDDPQQGLLFDGRIAENFKLATGTWVGVGALRARFLDHFAPYAADVVLTGLNRDFVGALIFPSVQECSTLAGGADDAGAVAAHPAVRAKFATLLKSFAAEATGSSNRVERAIILAEPPSVKNGEVADKGSINQRGVLHHRADLVEELYVEPPAASVLTARGRAS